MSKEVAEEYASSLADLTVNSKPLINMLTILAEENIDHAGVIVETVEKHLEKVHPDIKLPVLYLVDSIIKNVGGAYTQKFSQSIVNMFTRTFKQVIIVDEKIRSQMFKLRETWHDVFPATKLYQLDVKVNLIDPAWPIQAQPQQSNIHTTATTSTTVTPAAVVPAEEDEKMRNILAKKEQELLMLQRKKVEMELEQMRRQVELAEKTVTKKVPGTGPTNVNAVNMAAPTPAPAAALLPEGTTNISAKQRLGPPVPKSTGRIAPVSASLASARRDPRLARLQQAAGAMSAAPSPPVAVVAPAAAPLAPIAPNVFDIKPLERVTKRKNVITIDVRQDAEPARPATRDPRRRDPRLEKRDPRRTRPREERERRREELRRAESERNHTDTKPEAERNPMPAYVDKLPDPKKISKMPPIPKITRPEVKRDSEAVPAKRKRDNVRTERRRRREELAQKEGERAKAAAAAPAGPASAVSPAADKKRASPELVAFKELRNYHKEHYMRRNRDKSASPEHAESGAEGAVSSEPPSVPEIISETKDVDLRVLPAVVTEAKAASVGQKRSSTETAEVKAKKTKIDKFDVLFGNEDVDLRQLPQVDEVNAPPPPSITGSPKSDNKVDDDVPMVSPPKGSPKRDWNEIKKREKTPSKLDLVRAKFAEVTKGKDRLGRPLLFSKSPSIERERRRTLSSEDTDLREDDEQGFVENKKSISIIMSQAKEHFTDGQLDKNQYNTLMYQILQLNEKLKLKEAKQRESLEISKRKLKATIEENHKVPSPKSSPNERNRFGDIDERITPSVFLDTPPDSQGMLGQDSDMRLGAEALDMKTKGLLPIPPMMPMFGPYQQQMPWRGPRPRAGEEFGPRRFRGPMPPYFRAGKFDKRAGRPPFDPRMAMPPLPTPKIGMCQGECPLTPYERSESPPPLGAPGFAIPPTDFKVIEYIDQDPFKTIQIDGIPREIRFYGNTAVIMLDWDDPREIKFLPGCRRVTFDNKDSVVLTFNEGYKQVEFDDQVFDIKFGAPTRELYINGRWYECFFGGQPLGVIIDGKPRLVHLEGPMPQVDIGKAKRTDLVAGKINLIVNATQMHPVYLDAKVQKILVNGQYLTVRFVDSLRTVLINEQPFKVEFGGLPKPIVVGSEKYFVRFSALPRNIKPGHVQIANMEGIGLPLVPPVKKVDDLKKESENPMEVDQQQPIARPVKTPSPELNPESLGLDMLASVMPSSTVPASGSEYSVAEPLFSKTDKIPGLETPMEEKPAPVLPLIGNINVNDLFAKLVATGIVQVPITTQPEPQDEAKSKPEEVKNKTKEDKNIIHKVDFMKSETFRVKQPGLVAKLYGGMQCSGCGARFPPEHTVRYSQHLDWHFRQNRRDRDSARRAHSRHWHYDLSDWVQYEEVEDLEEREKSWFETGGNPAVSGEGAVEPPAPAPLATPSAAASAPASHCCALCGDMFQQFYNEDKEEWHLRNAIKHNDDYYHPLCFEDYKTSLTKAEEPKVKESSDDVATEEKTEEEAIEIKDVDETAEQSDNESVVEVVEDPRDLDPVEIDEEEDDEDDVVFKAEPVVQVVVEDDVDTDDELTAERAERDRLAEIDFTKIKVKQEPIDPDDEPILTAEEETIQARIDHTHPTVESSIDGNLQLDAASIPTASIPIGGIRINISKSLPSFVNNQNQEDKMLEDVSADDEPLPPGEEPELEYTLKPALEGVQFSRQPPVNKGNELSGLCSIM
ncbi:pre-mRNA cleavage complex 2 protein Pcf11 isoform X3 [Spodoptera frugiperda]|uniref:Pre-mRNA cleavage complex 2 protein Pcf11 isoform X3 n=1 Tax=Spodoptera frugiperda TaxID=7108 RepID=A0A9R0D703_SPOFR|nr:pre-mRNA cleavage complex 2 protein Pcf11 isoform X3 [Spodoptera frugiperda]